MIKERSADEVLNADGLCFSSEASDEAAIEIRAAADAIAVLVIRVDILPDGFFADLRDQSNAEEWNGISQSKRIGLLVDLPSKRKTVCGAAAGRVTAALRGLPVRSNAAGQIRGRDPGIFKLVLRKHSVNAKLCGASIRESLGDELEVAIVTRGAAEYRLFVTMTAGGHVEVWAQTILRAKTPEGDGLASLKRGALFFVREGNHFSEWCKDILCERSLRLAPERSEENKTESAKKESSVHRVAQFGS